MRILLALLYLNYWAVYSVAATTSCTIINNCNELRSALLSSQDGNVNVCAEGTIKCDETMKKIWLNSPDNPSFKLNCVTSDSSCGRCLIDFEPTNSYDGSSAYGGFVLQQQNELTVDGFEFVNFRGSGQIFYNQKGSKLTIRNSVFMNNIYSGTNGKNPIIVYDFDSSNGLVTTIIENSLFKSNGGSLLGFQAGNAILRNNIFYDNGLPDGYESAFTHTSFIFWKPVAGANFIVEGNHFHSFEATNSSGAHEKFFMISATSNDFNTTALFSGIGDDNCASNNDVAGEHLSFSIVDCNDGVFGKGTWPNIECLPFAGEECSDYGASGPPMPCATLSESSDSTRKYFLFSEDKKALDIVPDSGALPLVDQTADSPASMEIFSGVDGRTHYGAYNDYQGVPANFYSESDSQCSPPTSTQDLDSTWPGEGCACFEPGFPEVSYLDMADQPDPNNAASGYRTAFDTSVTGGVTVAGWFKAGDTSGDPWNATDNHPGQQTSLIFIRGEKASWKAGYNLGMGLWNSFRFEVILKGPGNDRYALSVGSESNAYPGLDVWHYVVGVYDAELGRAALYVDNRLVASKSVPFNWERWEKDIQWKGSDSEFSKSRIGNGYDTNDKNFHGCTGGFAVYGKAIEVSDSPFDVLSDAPSSSPSNKAPTPTGPTSPTTVASSNGDPHFKTFHNEHFEFHGQCDVVMASVENFGHKSANNNNLAIHLRTKMVRFWSYIESAAIRIGNDILEVKGSAEKKNGELHYWINFESNGELSDGLGGFPVTINPGKNKFTVHLDSVYPGQKIQIGTFMEFVSVNIVGATEESFGNSVGIIGDFNTGKTLARDGHTVLDDFSELGLEWQVMPSDGKLFHEIAKPQFPESCLFPEDPRGDRARRLAESTISVEDAEAACAISLKDPLTIKDCVYDILATQNLEMVGAF